MTLSLGHVAASPPPAPLKSRMGGSDLRSGSLPHTSKTLRSPWWAIALPFVLASCQEGVLDPQGTVGAAEKKILIDSLAIMLAIVVPTIVATLGFAWWFRASNTRGALPAGFRLFGPHRAHRLVDPAADGHAAGRRRLDRHRTSSIPRRPLASDDAAARGAGRLAGLEVAVHLPGPGRRQRQPACRPGRRADPLLPDLGERDERVLHPAARQHDLHDERHGDAAQPAGRRSRARSGASRATTAATASPTCISRCRRCRPSEFAAWIDGDAQGAGPTLDAASYAELAKQSANVGAVHLRGGRPGPVPADRHAETAAWTRARRPGGPTRAYPRGRRTEHARQARAGRPFRSTSRSRWSQRRSSALVILGVLAWVTREGLAAPYLWREWITSVDHKRIGVMYCAARAWSCCCAASPTRS